MSSLRGRRPRRVVALAAAVLLSATVALAQIEFYSRDPPVHNPPYDGRFTFARIRYANEPALACRPFDRDHDGFIFGESCGAVVIESLESSRRRGLEPYAALRGWGIAMDGNRNPDPSLEGETMAIQNALDGSGWQPAQIDYVNPHGTGSIVGDETELKALHACGLTGAYLNATKSLIGHGLSAAGAVEVIATLLQMQAGRVHPTRNLEDPIDPTLNWVRDQAVDHPIENALTLSMGFGGINTALCWQRHH